MSPCLFVCFFVRSGNLAGVIRCNTFSSKKKKAKCVNIKLMFLLKKILRYMFTLDTFSIKCICSHSHSNEIQACPLMTKKVHVLTPISTTTLGAACPVMLLAQPSCATDTCSRSPSPCFIMPAVTMSGTRHQPFLGEGRHLEDCSDASHEPRRDRGAGTTTSYFLLEGLRPRGSCSPAPRRRPGGPRRGRGWVFRPWP